MSRDVVQEACGVAEALQHSPKGKASLWRLNKELFKSLGSAESMTN